MKSSQRAYTWCGTPAKRQAARNKAFAKIAINWKQARPDLRHSESELRAELYNFVRGVLGLERLGSLRELSDGQLGKVIEELARLHKQAPRGCNVHHLRAGVPPSPRPPAPAGDPGSVTFISGSTEQIWAINKLLEYLAWTPEQTKEFVMKRYKRGSVAHLRPKECDSLMMILFTIAASRDLKTEGLDRVPRSLVKSYIPLLKAKLGIDQAG